MYLYIHLISLLFKYASSQPFTIRAENGQSQPYPRNADLYIDWQPQNDMVDIPLLGDMWIKLNTSNEGAFRIISASSALTLSAISIASELGVDHANISPDKCRQLPTFQRRIT
jgi:hypothetical protein